MLVAYFSIVNPSEILYLRLERKLNTKSRSTIEQYVKRRIVFLNGQVRALKEFRPVTDSRLSKVRKELTFWYQFKVWMKTRKTFIGQKYYDWCHEVKVYHV